MIAGGHLVVQLLLLLQLLLEVRLAVINHLSRLSWRLVHGADIEVSLGAGVRLGAMLRRGHRDSVIFVRIVRFLWL